MCLWLGHLGADNSPVQSLGTILQFEVYTLKSLVRSEFSKAVVCNCTLRVLTTNQSNSISTFYNSRKMPQVAFQVQFFLSATFGKCCQINCTYPRAFIIQFRLFIDKFRKKYENFRPKSDHSWGEFQTQMLNDMKKICRH